jgi:GNAT superfamily N-acetyltransferase
LSKNKTSPSEVLVRSATPADTPKVLAFLEDIWEGGDYLPSVWHEWLQDPLGRLVVAELEGEPIGTGRLANLGWGEYWLEGLRVATGYRRNGVAARIQEHLLAFWEAQAGSSIGYLTHRDQTAVHKLAQTGGFDERFRVRMMRWDAAEGEHSFKLYDNLSWASEALMAWSHFNNLDGRMELGWTYPKIIPQRLNRLGDVFTWRDRKALVALDRDDSEGEQVAVVACVQFEVQDFPEFFVDLRRLCSMLELAGGRWFAPSPLVESLKEGIEDGHLMEDLEMVCYLKSK